MRSLGMFWRLNMRICNQFLLVLWIFTLYSNVEGVPSEATVMKARCYANCLTQNAIANETEKTCLTSACQECLIPCGDPFSGEISCKQKCNNVSSCLKSCEFLTLVQNFSSILNGDGSTPPTPTIPTVTSTNFTSISLKWDPVRNTSGSAVYLIQVTFTGEQSRFSPRYLSEVFVSPQATIKFEHPCVYSALSPFKSEYTDILYRFKVAVLTENSSVSYGLQTPRITLSKPDPVTNITVDSLVYDSDSQGDKIKLTVSWIPPKDQKDLISKYGMLWNADASCQGGFLPRAQDTTGPETSLSIHFFHKSLKCNQTVEIHSIIGCSVSDPTVFTYAYPGCQNITNFPKEECYKFDPPSAPLVDRMVSNVTLEGPMTPQEDFRFQGTVTWNKPVYPYKNVQFYVLKWSEEKSNARSGFMFSGSKVTPVTRHTMKGLLPGTKYKIEVRPMFIDGKPSTDWTSAIITSPACIINGICCEESDNQNSPQQPSNE